MQHRHHIILYRIKYQQQFKKINNEVGNNNNNKEYKYEIPRGLWFKYCCCPHYTAEILIYVSFIFFRLDYDMMALLLWVIMNLSVVGKDTLKWYLSNEYLKDDIPKVNRKTEWWVILRDKK